MHDRESIRRELAACRSLGDVLAWAGSRIPRAEFVGAVGMDEFTSDVVVRFAPDGYAVFDTT